MEMQMYLVTDCEFNKLNYPALINRIFKSPPGYARVKLINVNKNDYGYSLRNK